MKDILFSYDNEYDVCYSSLDRARSELFQRRSNHKLENRLQQDLFLTPELAEALSEPRLVLFRQIATPLNETAEFLRQANLLGIKPLIFEYHNDKFVGARNLFKKGLGKMPIFKSTSIKNIDIYEYKTIVDFSKYDGKRIKDVKTVKEENLVDLHHFLFEKCFDLNLNDYTVDLSSWFTAHNDNAAEYYEAVMLLFLRNAILCENFVTSPDELDFFSRVARPSFKKICEQYGLDPLVIRIVGKEQEQRLYWDCYPSIVGELLAKKGYT